MREYGFLLPVTGLKTQDHSDDGHESVNNLIVEKGYWRVPDAPNYCGFGATSLFWTKENGVYPIMTEATRGDASVYRVVHMLPYGESEGVNDRTLLASAIGTPYGFAEFVGDTWVLTGMKKLVYAINGTVASVVNGPNPNQVIMEHVCSHLKSRLLWSKGTMVAWSAIGVPELVQLVTGAAVPSSIKLLNQSHVMHFKNLLGMYALDDNVILYGTDRVIALRQAANGQTYGAYDIEGLPRSVGMLRDCRFPFHNNDFHIFIGSDRNIWRIDRNLKATQIGYRWVFDPLLISAVHITRDATNHGIFLSFLTQGSSLQIAYYLNGQGLSGPIPRWVTSTTMCEGVQWLTGFPGDNTDEWSLLSGDFDMANNGQKTITVVNVQGDDLHDVRVKPYMRYALSDSWREGPSVRTSPEGAAFTKAAMNYGRVLISGTGSPGARLTRAEIRYHQNDKRFVRGTRAAADTATDDNA